MRDLIEQYIPIVKDTFIDLPKPKEEMNEEDWFDLAKDYVIELIQGEYFDN